MILLPLVILTLAGGAYAATSKETSKGKVTPERALLFETALNEVKDPAKLKSLAAAYKREGLTSHAALLEKRANLRELPPEVKAERREAFRKGMASRDPKAVLALAAAFRKEGATGAANALTNYAKSLSAESPKAVTTKG